jgi:hypothetical protein
MQSGVEGIENLLLTSLFMTMLLKKISFAKKKMEKKKYIPFKIDFILVII